MALHHLAKLCPVTSYSPKCVEVKFPEVPTISCHPQDDIALCMYRINATFPRAAVFIHPAKDRLGVLA